MFSSVRMSLPGAVWCAPSRACLALPDASLTTTYRLGTGPFHPPSPHLPRKTSPEEDVDAPRLTSQRGPYRAGPGFASLAVITVGLVMGRRERIVSLCFVTITWAGQPCSFSRASRRVESSRVASRRSVVSHRIASRRVALRPERPQNRTE